MLFDIDAQSETLPKRIRIDCGPKLPGFWQSLQAERLRLYCTHCFRQGRGEDTCKAKKIPPKAVATSKANLHESQSKESSKHVWRLKDKQPEALVLAPAKVNDESGN